MSNAPPWKVAVIGGVAIIAGVALLLVDWSLPQLAAFVRPHWQMRFISAIVEIALGVTLIARPGGTVRGAAVTLGTLAILAGLLEISAAIVRKRDERRVHKSSPARSIAMAS